MRGGKYLAEERGAFELPCVAVAPPEPPVPIAVAPLFEIAASHDGQPPMDWLRVFMQVWNRQVVS
jgi:hypothetical protein